MQLKVRISMIVKRMKGENWRASSPSSLVLKSLENIKDKLGPNVSLELVSRDTNPS